MELQQLKTFTTIAKIGSFTRAAEVLDYAQSSISAQVRALEDELETKLFERLGREVSLTEAGERLLVFAEKLLKLAEEAKESVTGATVPQGTLTIGAPESLCIFKLPPLLQEYRNRFPKVKLILKLGSCSDIYGWLRKNQVDVAFLLNTPLAVPDFVMERLSHEPMTLISGRNHVLAKKTGGADAQAPACLPTDIAGEDLIVIAEGDCCYRIIFESQLTEAGVQPGSILELGSVESTKKCVISGLGVTLLPRMTVQQEIAAGQLTDLHWSGADFNIYVQMIHHKDKWISPALAAMLQLSREMLREPS